MARSVSRGSGVARPHRWPLAQRPRKRQVGAVHPSSRRLPASLLPSLVFAFGAGAGLTLTACGRPATEPECLELTEKVARLTAERELKGAAPAVIDAKLAESREKLHEKARRECVGKRISDSAMACVRNAKTVSEIETQCFKFRLGG